MGVELLLKLIFLSALIASMQTVISGSPTDKNSLSSTGSDSVAWLNKADLLLNSGKYNESIEAYEKAIEAYDRSKELNSILSGTALV